MKKCPVCQTSYADDTLSFCLSDGRQLIDLIDDFPTEVLNQDHKVRVEIPQQTSVSRPAAENISAPIPPSRGGLTVLLGIIAVILVFAVIVVIGGLAFYFSGKGSGDVSSNNNINRAGTPAPQPSSTKDDKEELREQIANLEKRLNEQRTSNRPANIQNTIPNQTTSTITARVNSPGDGFLALRSLPSSEVGDRILKIPHGAMVSVGACGPVKRPGNRTGRWCQANYNGYSGWVFDGYLIY